MRILLAALVWFCSGVAVAFPEMARLGYSNCSSCHVSPSGGGVLTPYGKGASEDILSTWSAEGEGSPLHGLVAEPERVTVGGHARYIWAKADGVPQDFLMQAQADGAVRPIPGLWLVGTAGVYGPKRGREFREHYALVQLNRNTSVRAGRFMRSYGLNVADHTTLTRTALGFGEGQETYNGEIFYHDDNGEVSATQVLGSVGEWSATKKDGYVYSTRSETAMVLRAAAYLFGSSQAGFSVMRGSGAETNRTLASVFAVTGLPWGFYTASETDWQRIDGERARFLSAETLGWEPVRGLHLTGSHEGWWDERDPTFGAGVEWFPRPHFDLTLRAKWSREHYLGYFMLHYYL